MQINGLLFALLGLVALSALSDAAVPSQRTPFSRALRKRQFGGGFGGGGFGGGNGFNNGGFNNGGNNNQGDQNNGGQNNGDQNNGEQNNGDQAQDDQNNGDQAQDDQNNGDQAQDDQNDGDQAQDDQNNNDDNNNNNDGNNNGGGTALDANNIQTGSQQDGNQQPADGQSASATDDANFINFCTGETLTNGEQNQGGSCNGIPMGKIPSTNNMVSSVFVSPQNGDDVAENQDFDIQVQTQGLQAGSFTNAQTTYYSAPQDLNGNGQIIGHVHVTVQDLGGSQNPTNPLDPTQFAFFKGINDAGNGNGLLTATVDGGLPAGNYRICSMSSASNHQPVLMPVAQRGAQDDCVRVTVGGNNNNNDNNNNDNNNNDNNNNDNNNNDNNDDDNNDDDNNNGQDQQQDNANNADNNNNNNNGNNGNNGGFGGGFGGGNRFGRLRRRF